MSLLKAVFATKYLIQIGFSVGPSKTIVLIQILNSGTTLPLWMALACNTYTSVAAELELKIQLQNKEEKGSNVCERECFHGETF